MDGGVEGGGEAKEDKKNYARINLGKQSWIKYLSRIYMNISFFKLRIRILIPGDFLNCRSGSIYPFQRSGFSYRYVR